MRAGCCAPIVRDAATARAASRSCLGQLSRKLRKLQQQKLHFTFSVSFSLLLLITFRIEPSAYLSSIADQIGSSLSLMVPLTGPSSTSFFLGDALTSLAIDILLIILLSAIDALSNLEGDGYAEVTF